MSAKPILEAVLCAAGHPLTYETLADAAECMISEVKEILAEMKADYENPENERGLEVFAHYLDCEAHLDMYQEIYQTWHKRREDGAMEV